MDVEHEKSAAAVAAAVVLEETPVSRDQLMNLLKYRSDFQGKEGRASEALVVVG